MTCDAQDPRFRARNPYDAAFALACALVASVGVFSACHAEPAPPPDAAKPTAVASPAPVETPTRAEPTTNPMIGLAPADDTTPFVATVAERVRAGGYAYLRLSTEDGDERWLATMGAGLPTGAGVTVTPFGSRDNFHSRRTGMTFDHLLFGKVEAVTPPRT